MENNYVAQKTYHVFVVEESHTMSATKSFVLGDLYKSFSDYYEAEQWIQKEGERGTNYTIIEIFKKS